MQAQQQSPHLQHLQLQLERIKNFVWMLSIILVAIGCKDSVPSSSELLYEDYDLQNGKCLQILNLSSKDELLESRKPFFTSVQNKVGDSIYFYEPANNDYRVIVINSFQNDKVVLTELLRPSGRFGASSDYFTYSSKEIRHYAFLTSNLSARQTINCLYTIVTKDSFVSSITKFNQKDTFRFKEKLLQFQNLPFIERRIQHQYKIPKNGINTLLQYYNFIDTNASSK